MRMRRLSLRLVVALVTFFLGVAIASFWLAKRCSIQPTNAVLSDEMSAAHDLIRRGLEFKNPDFIDGPGFGEEFYEPIQHVDVSVIYESYPSSDSANSELRARVRGAVKVFETSPYIDKKGQQVGERVVAMFSPCRTSKREALILWTQGDTLVTVEAPSLRYAFAYELYRK